MDFKSTLIAYQQGDVEWSDVATAAAEEDISSGRLFEIAEIAERRHACHERRKDLLRVIEQHDTLKRQNQAALAAVGSTSEYSIPTGSVTTDYPHRRRLLNQRLRRLKKQARADDDYLRTTASSHDLRALTDTEQRIVAMNSELDVQRTKLQNSLLVGDSPNQLHNRQRVTVDELRQRIQRGLGYRPSAVKRALLSQWKDALELHEKTSQRIEELEKDIGELTQYLSGLRERVKLWENFDA